MYWPAKHTGICKGKVKVENCRGMKHVKINSEYVARDCHKNAHVRIVREGGRRWLKVNDEYVEEVTEDTTIEHD